MTDALSRRRTLPLGGIAAERTMADGWPLRSLMWPGRSLMGPGGPGSVLLLGGRGDFIEKYAETIHDLVDAGWGVASFDWRGQGLSGRVGDAPMKGAAPAGGFDSWLADLAAMADWFREQLPPPWHAIAHSMGAHLLLRHLAADGSGFARVVLTAPMLGLAARPLGAPVARRLARTMVRLGRGGDYVWRGGPYVPGTAGSPRQLMLTSDADRYGDEGWWIAQDPALALGSATWGWLDGAFASIDALRGTGSDSTPPLQRITTPVLVLVPERDGLVDGDVTRALVARMPTAQLAAIAATGHELLREASGIRAQVLARATRFLQGEP